MKLRTAVDVYAGLTRHGIEAGEPALELAKKVQASKNLKLIGLMGYSGCASHTHGWQERKKKSLGDTAGLLETAARLKSRLARRDRHGATLYNIDSRAGLIELQALLRLHTLYRHMARRIRLSPRLQTRPHRHDQVVSVASAPVLSTPETRRVEATDEVKGRPEVKVENQGAEYGILVWTDADRDFKLGERVELYPSNLDMGTNVYDRYYVARGEQIVDMWPIMGRAGAAQR